MTRRVVITGMGTVNALSLDLAGYWRALLEGRSGVGLIEQFDTTGFKVRIAGELHLERRGVELLDEPDAAAAFDQSAPVPPHVKRQGVHRAQPGDDDAPGHFLPISRSM